MMKVFAHYLFRNKPIKRIFIRLLPKKAQEKVIVTSFRETLFILGNDTSGIKDEDLKKTINEIGEVISKIGFTTKEMDGLMLFLARG